MGHAALPANLQPRLEQALSALGMVRDQDKIPQLLNYVSELTRWNKAYNLTAVRQPEDMLVQHVFDCLAIVPVMRKHYAGTTPLLADVGSGAGLPGLIIAICEPQWSVCCVDAVGKKMAFVRQAAGIIGLRNARALHGRLEVLPSLQADGVVSRAFASLLDFVTSSGHHCRDDGRLFAMKGQWPEDEIRAMEKQTAWRIQGQTVLRVPELPAQRCLIELALEDRYGA